jgi:hypothetical protein
MLLLALLVSSQLFAATSNEHCVIDDLQVQDQDGLQVCYAASASLMAQAADPERRPMSYFATAIMSGGDNSQEDSGQVTLETMITKGTWLTNGCSVFGRINDPNRGTCPAQFFPLEFNDLDSAELQGAFLRSLSDYFLNEPGFLAKLKARLRQDGAANCLASFLSIREYQAGGQAHLKKYINAKTWVESSQCQNNFQVGLKADQVTQAQALIDNILAYEGTGNDQRDFLRMIAPECEKNIVQPPGSCAETKKNPTAEDLGRIRESLCRGKPVTFNSCVDMLDLTSVKLKVCGMTIEKFHECNALITSNLATYSARIREYINQNESYSSSNSCAENGRSGGHVMTVVGSRVQNGEPQLLVQNSWGRDCTLHRTLVNREVHFETKFGGLECQVDASGAPTGRTWITASRFQQQAYRFSIMSN